MPGAASGFMHSTGLCDGGQKLIPSVLSKIRTLRRWIDERELSCDIEVDGGINAETSRLVREAGANVMVAGSAIYGAEDVARATGSILGYRGQFLQKLDLMFKKLDMDFVKVVS